MKNMIYAVVVVMLLASFARAQDYVLAYLSPLGIAQQAHPMWMQEDGRTLIGGERLLVKLYTDGGNGEVIIDSKVSGSFLTDDLGQPGWRLFTASEWSSRQLRRRLNVATLTAVGITLVLARLKWKWEKRASAAELSERRALRPQPSGWSAAPALRPALRQIAAGSFSTAAGRGP